ncbi:hypothetical protein ACWJJH_19945 [Endozoicomonadaceae bacterium StTr2]
MEYLKRFVLLFFAAAPVIADDSMSQSGNMMTPLNLECTTFIQKMVNNRPLKEPVMEVSCGVNGSSLIRQAYFYPQLRPFDNRYNSGDPVKSPLLIKQAGKPGFTFSVPLSENYASCRIEGFSNTRGCSPASFDNGQPGTLYMDFPIQLPGTQGYENLGDGSYCRFVCARNEMPAAEEAPLDITDFSVLE